MQAQLAPVAERHRWAETVLGFSGQSPERRRERKAGLASTHTPYSLWQHTTRLPPLHPCGPHTRVLWQMGSICFRSMGKLNRRAKLCKRQRRRHLLTIEHQLNVRRRTEKTVEDGSPFVGLR